MIPERISHINLTLYWWKDPPEWHAFASKLDENRQRVKPFTAVADDGMVALERVLEMARVYEFPPITDTSLKLELDLDL